MKTLLGLLGLFIPLPIEKHREFKGNHRINFLGWDWASTLDICNIPVGWLILVIAYLSRFIP